MQIEFPFIIPEKFIDPYKIFDLLQDIKAIHSMPLPGYVVTPVSA